MSTKPPSGGGAAGVYSSTGAGKDGTGMGYAMQVDAAPAMAMFQQATTAQATGYDQGLAYYQTAIQQANQDIKEGYQQANSTLQPMSYASGQALNQQMRMLGMDPLPATAGFSGALTTQYGAVKDKIPEANDYVAGLAQKMDAAQGIKDPQQRALALQDIQDTIGSGANTLLQGYKDQMAALQPPQATPWTSGVAYDPASAGYNPNASDTANQIAYFEAEKNGTLKPATGVSPADPTAMAAYNAQKDALQAKIDQATTYTQGVKDFGNTFAQNYTANYDAGYTPDQISNVVSNLPGYQFQLQAGTQALERSASANGMLGSGNTALAVQNYGQQQGMGYYNQYMNNLAGVQAEGAPATMQISANQSAQGTALATLAQNYGQAQMASEQSKANFAGQMLAQSAQLFNQDALFNAQAQNTSIENAKAAQNSQAQQAIASGPGYINAQTNANAQQLQNANSVSGATGYAAQRNSTSGATYNMGGLTFPNWTV